VLTDFWTSIGSKLADRWAAASAPALVFWLGGLLVWISSRARGVEELTTVTNWLNGQAAPVQIAAIVTALLALTASAIVIQRLGTPVLRILEGYWPGWLQPLRRRLVARVARRAKHDDAAWQQLIPLVQPPGVPSAEQLSAFAHLDVARRRRPGAANRLMPTRIGNILRASEALATDKYGLDAVALWPRLWLVLPDSAREQLASARTALDGAVAASLWGLLFCGFAVWNLLAIPVGLAVAAITITFWIPARAKLYGDLVEAAYDLYRGALYEQLRWPVPANPQEERAQGERLTSYLWRGSDAPEPTFTPPR
jgi:hypothetical protein